MKYFSCARKWLWICVAALAVYVLAAAGLWAWLPPGPIRTITPVGHVSRLSRDGRILVGSSNIPNQPSALPYTIHIWDLQTGTLRATLRSAIGKHHSLPVNVAPDGSLVTAVRTGHLDESNVTRLLLWDVDAGRHLDPILLRDDNAEEDVHVSFAPDGKTLAFATRIVGEDAVVLWDLSTRQTRAILTGQQGPLAFTSDGQKLATISTDGLTTKIWDVTRATELAALQHPKLESNLKTKPGRIEHMAFSADDTEFGMIQELVGLDKGKSSPGKAAQKKAVHAITVWNLATERLQSDRFSSLEPAAGPDAVWEGVYLLESARISKSSWRWILVRAEQVSAAGEVAGVHDIRSIWSKPMDKLYPSADGTLLVAENRDYLHHPAWLQWFFNSIVRQPFRQEGQTATLHVYDVRRKQHLATLHGQFFGCFSLDNQQLVTISTGGKIKIWQIPPRQPWLAILAWPMIPAAFFVLFAVRLRRATGLRP